MKELSGLLIIFQEVFFFALGIYLGIMAGVADPLLGEFAREGMYAMAVLWVVCVVANWVIKWKWLKPQQATS